MTTDFLAYVMGASGPVRGRFRELRPEAETKLGAEGREHLGLGREVQPYQERADAAAPFLLKVEGLLEPFGESPDSTSISPSRRLTAVPPRVRAGGRGAVAGTTAPYRVRSQASGHPRHLPPWTWGPSWGRRLRTEFVRRHRAPKHLLPGTHPFLWAERPFRPIQDDSLLRRAAGFDEVAHVLLLDAVLIAELLKGITLAARDILRILVVLDDIGRNKEHEIDLFDLRGLVLEEPAEERMSPSKGTLVSDVFRLSLIKPPMTMVWRSFTTTVVIADRLLVTRPLGFR